MPIAQALKFLQAVPARRKPWKSFSWLSGGVQLRRLQAAILILGRRSGPIPRRSRDGAYVMALNGVGLLGLVLEAAGPPPPLPGPSDAPATREATRAAQDQLSTRA